MDKTNRYIPVTIIGVLLCGIFILILCGFFMYKSSSKTLKDNAGAVVAASVSKSIWEQQFRDGSLLDLKSHSDKDIAAEVGTEDIGEYNMLCGKLEDLFEILSEANYNEGFKLFSANYLSYSNITSIDEFKAFIEKNKYNNISPMINSVNHLKGKNIEIYVCNVTMYPRSSEDYALASDGVSTKMLLSNKGIPGTIVITIKGDNNVSYAFDGFIDSNKLTTVHAGNNIFDVCTLSRIDFANNISEYSLRFKNKSSSIKNIGKDIGKLIFVDTKGHIFYSEVIPQTIEYDVEPDMEIVIPIKVKHDRHNLETLKFLSN